MRPLPALQFVMQPVASAANAPVLLWHRVRAFAGFALFRSGRFVSSSRAEAKIGDSAEPALAIFRRGKARAHLRVNRLHSAQMNLFEEYL